MKILVVDDEFASRMKMTKALSTFGSCTTVDDGQSAVDAFKVALDNGEYFDLVTLDISMPDMDGIEVLFE